MYHAPVLLSNLESTVVKLLAALFYRSKRGFYHNRESLSSPNRGVSNSPLFRQRQGRSVPQPVPPVKFAESYGVTGNPQARQSDQQISNYHLLVSIIPRILLPTMRLLKVLTTVLLYQKPRSLSRPELLGLSQRVESHGHKSAGLLRLAGPDIGASDTRSWVV